MDFVVVAPKESATDFDWSAPVTQFKEEKLELNWSDDEDTKDGEDEVDEAKPKNPVSILKTEKSKGNLILSHHFSSSETNSVLIESQVAKKFRKKNLMTPQSGSI